VTRAFLQTEDLHDLVTVSFGNRRRLVALDRLTGGTKKGVYRLLLDDGTSVILYLWAEAENYWPAAPTVPDDPFTDANGAELFAAAHAALTAAGVPTPQVLMLDRDGRHLDAHVALVEDAGGLRLDAQLERDPAAAGATLAALGDALRRLHTTTGPQYGKLTMINQGIAPQVRRTEDIIVDRALLQLDAVAVRDHRLADARERIAAHLQHLRGKVTPRRSYALVHGELGPDHVLVTRTGEPVIIDIEGLACFDVEWDHAWLQMRFGDAYPALNPVDVDHDRLELYHYAQVISLIEGPLRIADTDFPDRQWMLELAEVNIAKALNPQVGVGSAPVGRSSSASARPEPGEC
jgi:aminoglycoside phosphotransferase (APT) family kinase protein